MHPVFLNILAWDPMFEAVVVTMKKLEESRRWSQPKANSSDCLGNIIPSICSCQLNPKKLEHIKFKRKTILGKDQHTYCTPARVWQNLPCAFCWCTFGCKMPPPYSNSLWAQPSPSKQMTFSPCPLRPPNLLRCWWGLASVSPMSRTPILRKLFSNEELKTN